MLKMYGNTIAVILSAVLLSCATASATDLKTPKNFIVIFADDFGVGDLGCYNELFEGDDAYSLADEFTPNLDTLGRQGIRFMQTYAASWCAPSRTTLLSGRWCNRANVSAGMKSAWVKRPDRTVFDPWGIEPTVTVDTLSELCETF